MPLTGLAAIVYPHLQRRVPSEDPRVSYEQLVEELGDLAPPNQNLSAYDQRLFAALGEIGTECHRTQLPALSSVVVQQIPTGLGMPGPGYFPVTHPNARTDEKRIEAWLDEFRRCRQTTYPDQL